jgi:hypothetical protein
MKGPNHRQLQIFCICILSLTNLHADNLPAENKSHHFAPDVRVTYLVPSDRHFRSK